MITASSLQKRFGAITAVQDVTLEVQEGEILAILGPNGAGKTTTIRMLCSLLQPTAGSASICGYDTVKDAGMVRGLVGLLTEMPGLYSRLDALQYLEFFGRLQSVPGDRQMQRAKDLLQYFGLWEYRDRPISTYSKGMRQKLALARSLVHDPKAILLDEPTSAMDPYSAKTVRDHIKDLKKDGRAVILCTHNLAEAEELANRIAILMKGRIVAQGSPEELKSQFLGDPSFEISFSRPVDESILPYDGVVHLEEWDNCRVRYRTSEPYLTNPGYISHLVAAGAELVKVAEVPRRLEDVYLKVARSDE